MKRATGEDAQAFFRSLLSAYAAIPKNLKVIDLYVSFAVSTALIQAVYMAMVGSYVICLSRYSIMRSLLRAILFIARSLPPYPIEQGKQGIQGLGPADFVLCNLVLHSVIMNFLG